MIRHIRLDDFKCFHEAELQLSQLNVFAGSNGTGKSTVVQALLVLFQSAQSGALERERVQLNGPLIDLGTGRDVLFKRSNADRFSIVVGDDTGELTVVGLVSASEVQHTLAGSLELRSASLKVFKQRLFYLSADRLGPQKSYPMSMDESLMNEVGRRGEFAPLLFSRSRREEVKNERLWLENTESKANPDLENQFILWMRRMFAGYEMRADSSLETDSVVLGLSLNTQIGGAEFLRPSNVGFGVSIIFPIVLCGLLAGNETTLIVENPEAHLHPSAQSLIGEFLARTAAGGAQVFVETHSDHVINGMRIAVANGVLSDRATRFFAFTKNEEYGSNRVIPVQLERTGEFTSRPEAFFDQFDKDLKTIYRI